ncbi:MAG: 2Fe-2S iron-sulfur cluster-binding protein, partial [Alphaproteobacteria bacterium]|nr:2Fe-2S iron-sulfur cluster-binding protein [Alphaproteobacteria bacterium]
MTVVNRLPEPAGILLDRSRTISFTFDGRSYTGFAGDTVASAVVSSGQRVLSRSFKYHRPRGVLTMAGHDANTLVELEDESSILADRLPISEGLHISAQNYWGSLKNDRGMILDRFSKFLPVGFYYKTFFRPNWSFKYWEKLIRAMAGIGKVNLNARHEYYDKAYGFCDVAIVGAGPAGLAAALAAGDAGAEVILIDENPILGGSLNYARFDTSGEKAGEVRSELVGKVENHAQITIYTDAVCQACFAENWLPVTKGNRLYKIRAQELVVCTGSLEQHLIFRNNDLPGIMMGGAAQRLIRLYGVRPGDRAVVTATTDDGYAVALDLLDAGVQVAAIVDLRKSPPASEMQNAVRGRDIPVLAGSTITEAVPGPGKRSIRAVNVAEITTEGEVS